MGRTTNITDRMIDAAASGRTSEEFPDEKRARKRHTYLNEIALVLITPTGEHSPPMVLKARDISAGGICVISRPMIYPGSIGAVQLVRSDGKTALVGVTVQYCRYEGSMEHHTGLQFTPLSEKISASDFLDRNGSMPDLKTLQPGAQPPAQPG